MGEILVSRLVLFGYVVHSAVRDVPRSVEHSTIYLVFAILHLRWLPALDILLVYQTRLIQWQA
jgi:hypothetical protein